MRAVGIILLGVFAAACDPSDYKRGEVGGFTRATSTLSLRIEGPTQLIVGESATYQLIVTTTSGVSSPVAEGLTWYSSDYKVLNNGTITFGTSSHYSAVSSGFADVEAIYDDLKATLRVTVVGNPTAETPPTTTPELPPSPPRDESPSSLTAANGEYPITATASPDPCTGFPLNYVGSMTVSGVRDDGTGGSGLLRKNGVASAYGSNVTVRREGSGFVIEFTARLALNGSFYDYSMRWNLGGLTPGATFTGTQTLSGPCSSQGTVRGTKGPS